MPGTTGFLNWTLVSDDSEFASLHARQDSTTVGRASSDWARAAEKGKRGRGRTLGPTNEDEWPAAGRRMNMRRVALRRHWTACCGPCAIDVGDRRRGETLGAREVVDLGVPHGREAQLRVARDAVEPAAAQKVARSVAEDLVAEEDAAGAVWSEVLEGRVLEVEREGRREELGGRERQHGEDALGRRAGPGFLEAEVLTSAGFAALDDCERRWERASGQARRIEAGRGGKRTHAGPSARPSPS